MSKSSFNAFKSVDDLVAKPVIGSDGANSWQNFQKEAKHIMTTSQRVAPNLPLKRADRLAGITSVQQERQREEEIRKESGKAGESTGYTVFKRKNEAEEAMARKKRTQIEKRIRPDEKKYFISAPTFEGFKIDYVFTTRDRGTGYYWDGMDSLKKLNGQGDDFPTDETSGDKDAKGSPAVKHEEKPKKKKRKKDKVAPVIVNDQTNPMEQVADAIRRRNEKLNGPPSALLGLLPRGWEAATDPSGRIYYFCRASGERQWDRPTVPALIVGSSAGVAVADATSNLNELPAGWKVARDGTGKEYYYDTNGETRWDRPT